MLRGTPPFNAGFRRDIRMRRRHGTAAPGVHPGSRSSGLTLTAADPESGHALIAPLRHQVSMRCSNQVRSDIRSGTPSSDLHECTITASGRAQSVRIDTSRSHPLQSSASYNVRRPLEVVLRARRSVNSADRSESQASSFRTPDVVSERGFVSRSDGTSSIDAPRAATLCSPATSRCIARSEDSAVSGVRASRHHSAAKK